MRWRSSTIRQLSAYLWKEARKYYANIIAPFAPILRKKLEEITALNLPIEMIAPSHGAIWRENPMQIVEKYAEWAQDYQEDQGDDCPLIPCGRAPQRLPAVLREEIHRQSPDTVVKVFNISKSDKMK